MVNLSQNNTNELVAVPVDWPLPQKYRNQPRGISQGLNRVPILDTNTLNFLQVTLDDQMLNICPAHHETLPFLEIDGT